MKAINFILILLVGVAIIMPASALCESIYKWVDKDGVVHFSNVAPPADAEPVISSAPEKIGPKTLQEDVPETVSAEEPETEEPPVNDKRFSRDTLKKFLSERVEKRKKAIAELEEQIQRQPQNESLRKSLSQKRQYLEDDLKALRNYRD